MRRRAAHCKKVEWPQVLNTSNVVSLLWHEHVQTWHSSIFMTLQFFNDSRSRLVSTWVLTASYNSAIWFYYYVVEMLMLVMFVY